MKQPDRFQKLVQSKQTIWLSGHVSDSITAKNAIALLRRQHRQVVRIVKHQRLYRPQGTWGAGYNTAINDLLTALAKVTL